jgi:hypothetical protein
MRAKDLLVEFYEPADDQLSHQDYDDTRRPRLTMRHLHKLRVSKDMEKLDKEQHLDFLPSMYAPTPETDEGAGGALGGETPF